MGQFCFLPSFRAGLQIPSRLNLSKYEHPPCCYTKFQLDSELAFLCCYVYCQWPRIALLSFYEIGTNFFQHIRSFSSGSAASRGVTWCHVVSRAATCGHVISRDTTWYHVVGHVVSHGSQNSYFSPCPRVRLMELWTQKNTKTSWQSACRRRQRSSLESLSGR
jgi:hypothetical protein